MPATTSSDSSQSLDKLISIAKKFGATDAKLIKPSAVAVRDWVRLKCRYGCPNYGSCLTCPPYSPTPEETRRILNEYETAMLVRFGDTPKNNEKGVREYGHGVGSMMVKIEREVFLEGYYAAFAYSAGHCQLCEENCSLDHCRHPAEARPSMEGCGIDVFTTIRSAGFENKVVKSRKENPAFYGLLLVK
jgi:predicted metal-binding protein